MQYLQQKKFKANTALNYSNLLIGTVAKNSTEMEYKRWWRDFMKYIRVSKDNIDIEHICCALSNNKDIQVCFKKDWMKDCFDDGLEFIKSEQRGKCFIEYIPA